MVQLTTHKCQSTSAKDHSWWKHLVSNLNTCVSCAANGPSKVWYESSKQVKVISVKDISKAALYFEDDLSFGWTASRPSYSHKWIKQLSCARYRRMSSSSEWALPFWHVCHRTSTNHHVTPPLTVSLKVSFCLGASCSFTQTKAD